MTTTVTFKGADPNSRNSFQVLQPPGGGPNLLLGFDEPTEQVEGKNKWLLTSLTPEESPLFWAMSAGAKPSEDRESLELPGTQRINCSETSSRDFLGLK